MPGTEPLPPSPFLERQPERRFQFGLGTLLIAMSLCVVTSMFLVFASRLPLVTNEIHAWMGTVPSKNMDGSDRFTQLMFLLVCYSAPLTMTAVLYWLSAAVGALGRRDSTSFVDQEKEFEME